MANNAVAADGANDCTVYSVMGIGSGRQATDISSATFALNVASGQWARVADAPLPARVAAAAAWVKGELWLLGGFSVTPLGEETTYPRIDIYSPQNDQWRVGPSVPIPVDDQVVGLWRDRYVVSVSGWSNNKNVDAVQIYDTVDEQWIAATAFPGQAVFGHAGGIIGDKLIIIDGVGDNGGFSLVKQTWIGSLDADDPKTISWRKIEDGARPAFYRPAAGVGTDGTLWIVGGTSEPYNFDGLRYDDGQPASPSAAVYQFDPTSETFSEGPSLPRATMDHRGIARCPNAVYVVGGMTEGPQVTTTTHVYSQP